MSAQNKTLTALKGVRVGHCTLSDKATGCTAVVFDHSMPVAYKSYGGGAGTFNTEMLSIGSQFYRRHGLFIAGGSLSGLMSASSMMQAMIADKVGTRHFDIYNPAVSGAIIFDLGTRLGQYDGGNGALAYKAAKGSPVQGGNVGAGTGATVGKLAYVNGQLAAMKSGVGNGYVKHEGLVVTAMSVVNAVGNVFLPDGKLLAGNRSAGEEYIAFPDKSKQLTDTSNTTISIVGINVALPGREQYERVAHLAGHGHIRAINPVHMSIDGDTVFVFSSEERATPVSPVEGWTDYAVDVIGQMAAKAVQDSIYDACYQAKTISWNNAFEGVIPGCSQ